LNRVFEFSIIEDYTEDCTQHHVNENYTVLFGVKPLVISLVYAEGKAVVHLDNGAAELDNVHKIITREFGVGLLDAELDFVLEDTHFVINVIY